jgi:hypothetical protein
MALSEGQVQLRNLVMGPDTQYRFPRGQHFNPLVRSVRADQSDKRPWRDGSWSGIELADEAIIPMRVVTLGQSAAEFMALHQAMAAAFAPSSVDLDLTFMIGGVEYLMRGRPRLLQPDSRSQAGHGYYNAAFVGLDPLIYSSTLHTAGLVLPSFTGGLTVAVIAPISVTATVVSGVGAITNAGTAYSPLTIRIDGPCQEPRIAVTDPFSVTNVLRLALTLDAGQWLDIDTLAHTVYLNGEVSRRGSAYGDWPLLAPGTSDIAFDAAAYNASASATVYWRDAWR